MRNHIELSNTFLHHQIKAGRITFAGNKVLKIYGKLSCSSGKRMKKEKRVFFSDESEALAANYRPCGHCMKSAYSIYKLSKKQVDWIYLKGKI